jgi:PTS system mannose-specific IIA component
MIGIVVVTHGNLAGELVQAARTIVGDIPGIKAVSIGWADDAASARGAIEAALVEVGGEGALVLTDMFGGTPTNLTLSFLRKDEVEIVTGVNLPMVLKCVALQNSGRPVAEVARIVRDRGQRSIYVASDLLADEGSESSPVAERQET